MNEQEEKEDFAELLKSFSHIVELLEATRPLLFGSLICLPAEDKKDTESCIWSAVGKDQLKYGPSKRVRVNVSSFLFCC